MGTAMHDRPSWDQLHDLTRTMGADAAAQMWGRTALTPADVDVAELYDGFSYLTMLWLEALGSVRPRESGAFVEGGARIALDGPLPLNTAGGQLSAGRFHGYGFLHEACVQLRGQGAERQVRPGPRWPWWPPAAAPPAAACCSPPPGSGHRACPAGPRYHERPNGRQR